MSLSHCELREAQAEGCAAAWGWMAAEAATFGDPETVARRVGYAIQYAREAGENRARGEEIARADAEYERRVARGIGP